MFTRSAITRPKINRFGWNLEDFEYIVGGWPGQNLGAIRAEATAVERSEICCQANNARFHRFSVGLISRNLNTTRRSVRRWQLSEQNLKKITTKLRFSKKNAKIHNKISTSCDFRLPCLRNDYRSPESRYQMIPLVSTFTDGIKSKSFFWPVRSIQETTNFRRCPVLGKPSTPLCRLANNVEEKQAWIGNCK